MNEVLIKLDSLKLGDDQESKEYIVMSIDIGVNNLGLSVGICDYEYKLKEIVWIDLINITEYTHSTIPKKECKLHHTKTFSDWMEHIYQENSQFFERSDYILIERQPPTGFTVIEQLIFNRWRHKSYLINPVNIHCFMNIKEFNYEQRKLATEGLAKKILSKNKDLLEQFSFYVRKHDIGDSICMMLYWLDKRHKEYQNEINKLRIKESFDKININGVNFNQWIENFKHN